MANGAGGVVVPVSPRPRGRAGRRRHQTAAWLPLDIIAEIAVRSDPATLVRCAATCRDARRHIAEDPSLRGRLRLRDTDRFVLPLLRGHLTRISSFFGGGDKEKTGMYLVDTTTAADATRLVKVTFASDAVTETRLRSLEPVDSRGGLVLVRSTTSTNPWRTQLLVCNPATRRRLALLPEPELTDFARRSGGAEYVLLVGDGEGGAAVAVGRPFHVLRVTQVLSRDCRSERRLLFQTFSSEHGAWSAVTEIPTPNLHAGLHGRPLVVGDVVHWLCLAGRGSYVLMLHARTARVKQTALPASFPLVAGNRYLLATATAGGNPAVLVADAEKISAWEQSRHTKMWKPRPRVVIENEAVLGFDGELAEAERRWTRRPRAPELVWFAERSGAVLLRFDGCGLLWLDLHSKKIVRCSTDRRLSSCVRAQAYCPYEMDLSSWVPTFSSAPTF